MIEFSLFGWSIQHLHMQISFRPETVLYKTVCMQICTYSQSSGSQSIVWMLKSMSGWHWLHLCNEHLPSSLPSGTEVRGYHRLFKQVKYLHHDHFILIRAVVPNSWSPPKHCTFLMSSLSNTSISGLLRVSTNELMTWIRVCLIKRTCKMYSEMWLRTTVLRIWIQSKTKVLEFILSNLKPWIAPTPCTDFFFYH